jgi:uncharacterized membrane protein
MLPIITKETVETMLLEMREPNSKLMDTNALSNELKEQNPMLYLAMLSFAIQSGGDLNMSFGMMIYLVKLIERQLKTDAISHLFKVADDTSEKKG